MLWLTFLKDRTQMITVRKWTFVIMEITGKIKGINILGKVVCDNLVSNTLWCLMVSLVHWLFERKRNDLIHTVCTCSVAI